MGNNVRMSSVFPGQGSQFIGMGKDIYDNFKVAREAFQEADETLGYKLSDVMFTGSSDQLEDTSCSQPAIMAVSVACWRVLDEMIHNVPLKIEYSAGHSLGEYTSLVVAGVMDYADGLKLVQKRGQLMHDASIVRPGSMAAIIGLNEESLKDVCAQTGAEIANINSTDQIVISGDIKAVSDATELATNEGARKIIKLPVSGAFHSSLMEYALEGLSEILEEIDFKDPEVPIIANSTGLPVESAEEIKAELLSGLCSCVQWKNSIQYMVDSGVNKFVEFGPSKVLSSLIKRINKDVEVDTISDSKSLNKFIETHN
jgi:[acyl-carrier-protein] S-malonyltransferase